MALLLVSLAETNDKPVFSLAVDRFPGWYGFGERTAERGYKALVNAGVMRAHRQTISDLRMPRGVRLKVHRTLLRPFATQARRDAQKRAKRAWKKAHPARRRRRTASGRAAG